MKCCCIEPPEPPEVIVNLGTPYCSMKRSFTIIILSADTRKSQPVPSVLRVPNATANPRLSGTSDKAEVTALLPDRNAGPHPPPNGTVSLPFQPGPGFLPAGDHGFEIGLVGSSMIAMR